MLDRLLLPKRAQIGTKGPAAVNLDDDEYAIDIDGDGAKDAGLTRILGGLASYTSSYGLQSNLDKALSDGLGRLAFSIRLDSRDPSCDNLLIRPAVSNGGANVVPAAGGTPVLLKLRDQSETLLETPRPLEQAGPDPSFLRLRIPLHRDAPGGVFDLPLYGVHITLQKPRAPSSLESRMVGEIHGVLRLDELRKSFARLLASEVTRFIHQYPGDEASIKAIEALEQMSQPVTLKKCTNWPQDCCAKNPTTCRILPEEAELHPGYQILMNGDLHAFGREFRPRSTLENGKQIIDGVGVALKFAATLSYPEPTCTESGWCPVVDLPSGFLDTIQVHDISGSPDDMWVVGDRGTILHFDGSLWKRLPMPEWKTVSSVAARGDGTAWVAADKKIYLIGAEATKEWSLPASINRITVSKQGEAWAVGDLDVGSGRGLILRFNGTDWVQVGPSTRGGSLYDVRISSDGKTVWVVGQLSTILRWDGTSWTVIPPPPNSLPGLIKAIWLDSQDQPFIVGAEGVSMRWSGDGWRPFGPNKLNLSYTSVYGTQADSLWLAAADERLFHVNAEGSAEAVEGLAVLKGAGQPDGGERALIFKRLFATSPTDLWAVGHKLDKKNSGSGGFSSLIVHCSTRNKVFDCVQEHPELNR